MGIQVSRRAFCLSLPAASTAAARSWAEPQFPFWTENFVDRMLTDSPWARPLTVAFNLDSGLRTPVASFLPRVGRPAATPAVRGNGARAEIFLTIRWASALPIRQAFAIQQFGRGGLDSPEAVGLLARQDEDYVLEVAGFPTTLFKKGSRSLEDVLASSARLSTSGRPPVAPISVTVPEYGMHLMATLRFPRFENLQAADGSLTLSASALTMSIEQVFRLKSMVYQSRLEL